MEPVLKSSPVIKRYDKNPVLSAKDVPYEATLVYNAGVCKYQGRYIMVFRNDVYSKPAMGYQTHINLGLAFSRDGIHWSVEPKPCLTREYFNDPEVERVYAPRLIVLEGRVHLCFAMDTRHGLRGGIAVTDDFEKFEVLSLTVPDNRNMVLFPEKIGGKYLRLERPFPVYSRGGRDRFDIWSSGSPDLRYWGNSGLVMAVEAAYEVSGGIRNNVVFPGGMVLEDTGEVKIYYGAADTVECLAQAHVDDLLALCTDKPVQ